MKPLCVVSCPIDTFSGYGARSRDFVKALIQSKGEEWDIKIIPQPRFSINTIIML